MGGKEAPDRARVGLDRPAIDTRYPQVLQRDALRTQHPEDIMVGRHEKLGRVGKRLILGKPARVGVAVGADNGQVPDSTKKTARNVPNGRICRKQPVIVQSQGPLLLLSSGP